MARLLSVNVGLPRDIEWRRRTVHTAIWKTPVRGRCGVGRLNLEGDGQGDLAGHGGEQRAVFVYQIESYRYWQEHLKRTDFVCGPFGENFTTEGLQDDAVCIGDRYQIGNQNRSITPATVIFSFAAHDLLAILSSIYEAANVRLCAEWQKMQRLSLS